MKRRIDSCFGLHFDFHATPPRCDRVGDTLSEADVRELCHSIKPDFIQCDCKGHPGWTSYPSKLGNAMPRFAYDTLKMWRKVTREEGIALYMHYSGVMDEKYCTEHPEHTVMHADGTRSKASTRTFGFGYADNLLIPQLSELKKEYDIDGVWIDGDCWASEADYDPETVAGFEIETGIELNGKLPVQKTDAYYQEYMDYCRDLFRRYVRHVADTIHERYPDFQVASNWAFSNHMPEKVCADVDFISGDLSPWNSFVSARLAARAIAQQDKPWDLMSWNFRNILAGRPGSTVKHVNQILQEAAAVLALGGGFQNYITQYADGALRMEQIRKMSVLGSFIRERSKWCFKSKPVHQVAVLLSTYDRYHEAAGLFSRDGEKRTTGVMSLICDAGHSCEIVSEHTLKGKYSDYPVIVVPELFKGLESTVSKELLNYAENGGSLCLIGVNTVKQFVQHGLPLKVDEVIEKNRMFTLNNEEYGAVYDSAVLSSDAHMIAGICDDVRKEKQPFAVYMDCGKGKIACVGADIGSAYMDCAQYLHIELIKEVLKAIYTPKAYAAESDGTAEIVLSEHDGKHIVHIVNANGNHRAANIATEAAIPSLRDIKLTLRCEKPKALILQPENKPVDFTYSNGSVHAFIEKVPIYSILEIE